MVCTEASSKIRELNDMARVAPRAKGTPKRTPFWEGRDTQLITERPKKLVLLPTNAGDTQLPYLSTGKKDTRLGNELSARNHPPFSNYCGRWPFVQLEIAKMFYGLKTELEIQPRKENTGGRIVPL